MRIVFVILTGSKKILLRMPLRITNTTILILEQRHRKGRWVSFTAISWSIEKDICRVITFRLYRTPTLCAYVQMIKSKSWTFLLLYSVFLHLESVSYFCIENSSVSCLCLCNFFQFASLGVFWSVDRLPSSFLSDVSYI